MIRHPFYKADGCINLGQTDQATYSGEYCFELGDTHMCKAKKMQVGSLPINNGPSFVMVALGRSEMGLHLPLTPDAARDLAQAIVRAADEADSVNSIASNAQLAAALAKKGQ